MKKPLLLFHLDSSCRNYSEEKLQRTLVFFFYYAPHSHSYKLQTMRFSPAAGIALCLLNSICVVGAFQSLGTVKSVRGPKEKGATIDVGQWIEENSNSDKCMVVFGTYAADFNAIEYGQRLRYYWPKLRDEKNVKKCAFVLNCQPDAALALASKVELPEDIEIWVDNKGEAGRKFGVGRGWLPDNQDVNPFLKLFGMLWGLGAWATLPAVIGGYIGKF